MTLNPVNPMCQTCQRNFVASFFVLPQGNFTLQQTALAVTEGGRVAGRKMTTVKVHLGGA
jgi:hypothetical protein